MRPLKILEVASHNVIQSGGAIQIMRLAQGLKIRGHEVVCAFNLKHSDTVPGLGTFAELHTSGIKTLSFPMQRLQKYAGMLRFRKLLAENYFDVVHAHWYRALWFVYWASAGIQIPALVGDRKNSYPVPPAWAKIYGKNKVDRIIVNGAVIKDLLIKTGRVDGRKIEIIYNGVPRNLFNPSVSGHHVRAEFGINDQMTVFGIVANFASKKSHDIFFEAAEAVLQELPDIRFLLVGGGNYTRYEKQVAEKGFSKNFIFTGFRTDIPEILASLDCSLISSGRGEGLTGSLVESMAMAKPVISTDVGANDEFIKDKETGLMVPPGNARALADAIISMAKKIGRMPRQWGNGRMSLRKIKLTTIIGRCSLKRFIMLF